MIPILRLYWQLGWAHVLLWLAGAGRTSEPRPVVHLYLADLHYSLADEYEAAGKHRAARRHRQIAHEHVIAGPPPAPKPAAAMGMPVPQPPTFTDVRGTRVGFDPPDDIA